jgi:anaerobic C4-dicarboxylate transporter DcuA
MRKRGKELSEDPEFLKLMQDPAFVKSLEKGGGSGKGELKPGAKTAVLIFGLAILLIVLFGAIPSLVPNVGAGAPSFSVTENGNLSMSSLITIITLTAAGVIMLVTKTQPAEVSKSSLFTSMATAVVSVFGVVWMSATFMAANEPLIKSALGEVAQHYPWTFAFALFIMGALTFSQAATTQTMMPLGLTLGITHPHLLAMFPSVNGDFLLPGYPTLVAAIDLDRTGTTKVGKFLINHSFLLPGFVMVATAVAVGFLLSSIFF